MAALPQVLLLGDSIRMSYQALVADKLATVAEVVGPAENCQFSLHTLASLDRWLNNRPPPRVVHWNNGLHDCGHNPYRAPAQIPLADYVANLGFILRRLRQTGVTVIWATMTPVGPARPFLPDQWSWRVPEVAQYNAAATELMQREKVPINDLHALVAADLPRFLSDDHVHLTEAGRGACAGAVAAVVLRHLPAPGAGASR